MFIEAKIASAIITSVFAAFRVQSTKVGSDLIFAANEGVRVVRFALTPSIHFLRVAKVDSAIVTLGVATGTVIAAYSRVHYTSTALLGRWVVGQLAAERVDFSLIAEEEAGIVGVSSTALRVTTTYTSHNVAFTAFEKEV